MKILGAIAIIYGLLTWFIFKGSHVEESRLGQFYRENAEFRDYVDKYAEHRGLKVEAALKHEIVRIVAKDKFDYEV